MKRDLMPGKISLISKFAYGMGDVGCNFSWMFVGNFLMIREFDISTSLLNMSMSQPEHVLQHKEARKYR